MPPKAAPSSNDQNDQNNDQNIARNDGDDAPAPQNVPIPEEDRGETISTMMKKETDDGNNTDDTDEDSVQRVPIKDIPKFFDGIPKLKEMNDWTLWSFNIASAVFTMGYEEYMTMKMNIFTSTNWEKQIMRALYLCISKTIAPSIFSNYVGRTSTIGELMSAIKTSFDPRTLISASGNVGELFNIRGHVSEFMTTLDRFEKKRSKLTLQGNCPDDQTLIAAIERATPPQYKVIIAQLENQINLQNELRKSSPTKLPLLKLTPDRLITELRRAFTNYTVMNRL